MRIEINGESRTVVHKTLDELVNEMTVRPKAVATAVNGTFVPLEERGQKVLTEGDRIEVLSPMQGG